MSLSFSLAAHRSGAVIQIGAKNEIWPIRPHAGCCTLPSFIFKSPSKRCLRKQRRLEKKFSAASKETLGFFPAGQKQGNIALPALFVTVAVAKVLRDNYQFEDLSKAISGGVTAVLLCENDQEKSKPVSAGDLYSAAKKLREFLRGRASLFVVDRADIADAVSANGVILIPQGLPTSVAKLSLKNPSAMVGRIVESSGDAKTASAEGANFIMLKDPNGNIPSATEMSKSKSLQKGGAVPVIALISSLSSGNLSSFKELIRGKIDGISMSLLDIPKASVALGCREAISDDYKSHSEAFLECLAKGEGKTGEGVVEEKPRRLISKSRERLIDEEKDLLERILETLKKISPEIEEISLLEGASKQLDELFLVVVVGEYNSGKSSVVNALLGGKFLEEGILPTTNEISVLRYAASPKSANLKRTDTIAGYVERFLPAPLLREINIVDTPGTNVILERQQRLTEEYVPRADMVLFVMSCDRPFTESEVNFLRYIRKWGKKVVFVINKIDILGNESEIREVQGFVIENAKRLLNLDQAFVYMVSACKALEAKEISGNSCLGGLYSFDDSDLKQDNKWQESQFEILEKFISEFFSGKAGAASAESMRLKLQTPLYVADALLEASRRLLENKKSAAERDLNSAQNVIKQICNFEEEIRKDSQIQMQATRKIIDKVVVKAEGFVDETLQLSKIFSLRGRLLNNDGKESQTSKFSSGFGVAALGNVVEDLKGMIEQHSDWLITNCANQLKNYTEFASDCAEQLGKPLNFAVDLDNGKSLKLEFSNFKNNIYSLVKSQKQLPPQESYIKSIFKKLIEDPESGIEMCESMMESEVRDTLNSTAGTALAALGIGIFSTFFLPEAKEDILAICFSLLIGYVALLNLPLRRGEIKSKIRKFGISAYEEIENIFKSSTDIILQISNEKVKSMIEPLEIIFEGELDKVVEFEANRSDIENELNIVKRQVASIE